MPILIATVLLLVLIAATISAALALYVRLARRRAADHVDRAEYCPSSVEPRGRWRVSRFGDDLLEPVSYRLTTELDGPPGHLPPPLYTPPGEQPR